MDWRNLFIILIGFILFVVVLIIIAGAIIFWFAPKDIKTTSSPNPAPSATSLVIKVSPSAVPSSSLNLPTQSAEQVILAFYQWYTTCSGDAATTCNFKNSPLVDADQLGSNIDAKFANFNPIICAQNPPQSITIDHTVPHEGKTTVYLIENFGNSATLPVTVDLSDENDQWKIVNINCSH